MCIRDRANTIKILAVNFNNLGMIIIDEQHRFGVGHRKKLIEKGLNPQVLAMTATPIPRTMMMSNYGDMDISKITEKPAHRKKIITLSKPEKKIFDEAAKLAGVLPEEICHIGDHPVNDVEGALQAGFQAMWMNALNKDWEHPKALTVPEIKNWKELESKF